MAQHHLHSKEARAFARYIYRLTEEDAEQLLARIRWGCTYRQVCPRCGVFRKHYRRVKRKKWRCAECTHEFSVTSQSMLDSHKVSFKSIVFAVFYFLNGAKGTALLNLSRNLGWTPKTCQAFAGKIREFLVTDMDLTPLSGLVHMDGAYFCGKPREPRRKIKMPADAIAKRFGKKKIENSARPWVEAGMTRQNWEKLANKRVVISACSSAGHGRGSSRVMAFVCRSENSSDIDRISRAFISRDARIMTDESGAYGVLSGRFEHYTVRHAVEKSTHEGVNNNMSETYNSRMRRAEYGIYHGHRVKYLQDYACESAWRETGRTQTQAERVMEILKGLLLSGPSQWWRGYWQGRHRTYELGLGYFLDKLQSARVLHG